MARGPPEPRNNRPDPPLLFCDGVIAVVGNCFAEDFLIVVANIFEVGITYNKNVS